MNENQVIIVSIIIPTKNGGRYLEGLFSKIAIQRTSYPYEVICVDSGSKDATTAICRRHNSRLFEIDPDGFNHGRTRNLGIEHAAGEFIILLSQDASPYDENWLENLVRNLYEDSSIAGAYSMQIPYEDANALTKKELNLHFSGRLNRCISFIQNSEAYERMDPREKYMFCNFDNVSSCIRKNVWTEIPFPTADFAEDLDWAKRVLMAGYKIVYEPRSIVFHSHPYNLINEYKRTKLHHKRVYQLFGFKPIPKPWKILPFSMILILRDVSYLMTKSGVSLFKKFDGLLRLPMRIFMRTLAQYMGPRHITVARRYPL